MSAIKEAREKARELYDYFDQYPITIQWKKDCAKFVLDQMESYGERHVYCSEYPSLDIEMTKEEIDKIEC